MHSKKQKLSKESSREFKVWCLAPSDIIMNILLRIQGSILLRFRLVCKLWYNLLCDPQFVELHLARWSKRFSSQVAFYRDLTDKMGGDRVRSVLISSIDDTRCTFVSKTLHDLSSDPEHNNECSRSGNRSLPPNVVVLSEKTKYMNGCKVPGDVWISLIDNSLASRKILNIHSTGRKIKMTSSCNGLVCIYNNIGEVWILNPTTRECISLPQPPLHSSMWKFDRPECHLIFHPLTKEYKVVWILSLNKNETVYDVLTLGTRIWRTICMAGHQADGGGVTINGVLYVATFKFESDFRMIQALDLKNETFRMIPLPNSVNNPFHSILFEHRGCLCLSGSSFNCNAETQIWKLDDFNNGIWILLYQEPIYSTIWSQPIFFHGGRLMTTFSYEYIDYYDIRRKNNGYNKVHCAHAIHAQACEETLVSLKGMTVETNKAEESEKRKF